MKTMKKRVMGLFLMAALFVATLSLGVQADVLYNVGDYYYVSVSMDVSAGMKAVNRETPFRSGIGGEIEDWGQVVSAGNTVSASLTQKRSHSLGTPDSRLVGYVWQIYDANDQPVGDEVEGDRLYISSVYEGGYLVVKAVIGENGNWKESTVTSKVKID